MNIVFQRASLFQEFFKETVVVGKKKYMQFAAGHDLRGSDLLRFWKAADLLAPEEKQYAHLPQYLQGLSLEREFFTKVILPKINKENPQHTVFIAASADIDLEDTLSHEGLHARHMLDPKWDGIIAEYWNGLPIENKKVFQDLLSFFGYDWANDPFLLRTEFLAYLLQIKMPLLDEKKASQSEKELQKVRKLLRGDFIEYLRTKGVLDEILLQQ